MTEITIPLAIMLVGGAQLVAVVTFGVSLKMGQRDHSRRLGIIEKGMGLDNAGKSVFVRRDTMRAYVQTVLTHARHDLREEMTGALLRLEAQMHKRYGGRRDGD